MAMLLGLSVCPSVSEITQIVMNGFWSEFLEVLGMAQRASDLISLAIWFLPARRYASAGLCDSDVSVRPSVTRRYCA